MEPNPSDSTAQKGLWIQRHCQASHVCSATRSSTLVTCFDTHGRCWLTSNLEWRTLDWRTQSFYRQTQNGVLWGLKTERFSTFLHCKATVVGRNQFSVVLFERDTVHTSSSYNYKSISAGGLSPRSTRQARFFSALNPQEPSSRQRTIDLKRLDVEPRKVMCKHSTRPDHDCIYCFNLRRAQRRKFGISSK